MSARRRLPKLQGEAAESVFLSRVVSLGLTVSKPWGDSAKYDFIVDNGRRLFRTQVKSVALPDGNSYRITSGSGNRAKVPYTRRDIDLLAAYVEPFDTWYLIPVAAFTPATTIRLCPHRPSRRKFERFREAWNLLTLRETRPGGRAGLQPHVPTYAPKSTARTWGTQAYRLSLIAYRCRLMADG